MIHSKLIAIFSPIPLPKLSPLRTPVTLPESIPMGDGTQAVYANDSCPISGASFSDGIVSPHLTISGHAYGIFDLLGWCARKPTEPQTRQSIVAELPNGSRIVRLFSCRDASFKIWSTHDGKNWETTEGSTQIHIQLGLDKHTRITQYRSRSASPFRTQITETSEASRSDAFHVRRCRDGALHAEALYKTSPLRTEHHLDHYKNPDGSTFSRKAFLKSSLGTSKEFERFRQYPDGSLKAAKVTVIDPSGYKIEYSNVWVTPDGIQRANMVKRISPTGVEIEMFHGFLRGPDGEKTSKLHEVNEAGVLRIIKPMTRSRPGSPCTGVGTPITPRVG